MLNIGVRHKLNNKSFGYFFKALKVIIFTVDGGQQLLNIGVRHELNNKIIRLLL
jgi:hypothetical protein